MKWGDLKRTLRRKLDATETAKTKHDVMFVECCEGKVGNRVLISRGSDDMKGHELGNVASSLNLREHELRELVACTLSREGFCAKQQGSG